MDTFGKSQKLAISVVLGILFAIPVLAYATELRAKAKEKAKMEQTARTGLDAWWHNKDVEKAGEGYIEAGIAATAGGFWLFYVLAPIPLSIMRGVHEARQDAAERQREEKRERVHRESIKEMEVDSERQAQRMNLAQSKQSIVMQLGTFDQFIRVWKDESDEARKALAMQGAHAELTQMKAKLVAGELDSNSLGDPQVIDCAKATVSDLHECGLAGDRLCGDLRRVFRL